MRKFTKEKDNALEYFYGNPNSTKPSQEIIDILVADEYMELRKSVNGSAYYITDKGKGFILQGGYTKQDKDSKHKIRNRYLDILIGAIAGAVITKVIDILLK